MPNPSQESRPDVLSWSQSQTAGLQTKSAAAIGRHGLRCRGPGLHSAAGEKSLPPAHLPLRKPSSILAKIRSPPTYPCGKSTLRRRFGLGGNSGDTIVTNPMEIKSTLRGISVVCRYEEPGRHRTSFLIFYRLVRLRAGVTSNGSHALTDRCSSGTTRATPTRSDLESRTLH